MPQTTLYQLITQRRPLRMRLLKQAPSSGRQLADYDADRLTELPDADCAYDESSFVDAGSYVNITVTATWSIPNFTEHYYPLGCVVYTADADEIIATVAQFGTGTVLPRPDGGSSIRMTLLGVQS